MQWFLKYRPLKLTFSYAVTKMSLFPWWWTSRHSIIGFKVWRQKDLHPFDRVVVLASPSKTARRWGSSPRSLYSISNFSVTIFVFPKDSIAANRWSQFLNCWATIGARFTMIMNFVNIYLRCHPSMTFQHDRHIPGPTFCVAAGNRWWVAGPVKIDGAGCGDGDGAGGVVGAGADVGTGTGASFFGKMFTMNLVNVLGATLSFCKRCPAGCNSKYVHISMAATSQTFYYTYY